MPEDIDKQNIEETEASSPEDAEDTQDGATSTADDTQSTPPPDKFLVDGVEYSKEQLQEAIEAQKNKSKWSKSLDNKGQEFNNGLRELKEAREEFNRKTLELNRLREEIHSIKSAPEVDLNSIEDPIERLAAAAKLQEKQVMSAVTKIQQLEKELETKDAAYKQEKLVTKWNNYLEDTIDTYADGLSIEEKKVMAGNVLGKLGKIVSRENIDNWQESWFTDCATEARKEIDAIRKQSNVNYSKAKQQIIKDNKVVKVTPSTPPKNKNPLLEEDPIAAMRENMGWK